MFEPQFHQKLKDKRSALGLTQAQAAKRCGLTQIRWSRLETGTQAPDPQEFRTICRKFQLGKVFARPKNAIIQLKQNGGCKAAEVFVCPRDRNSDIRFRAAQREAPLLVDKLVRLIKRRDNYKLIQHVCHQISFDSSLETMFVCWLLANNAVPALRIPYLQGHLPHPIICPGSYREVGQQLHYCLKTETSLYFFQVTFRTFPTCRVDVLVRRKDKWEVLEINGHGHDGRKDPGRSALIGLPTTYLSQRDLENLARSSTDRLSA